MVCVGGREREREKEKEEKGGERGLLGYDVPSGNVSVTTSPLRYLFRTRTTSKARGDFMVRYPD